MKAFSKNILREIWQNKSRFISIFLMAFLSVAFYVGILATAPDMRYSADAYYKQQNFMDFNLVSTIGFNDEDIQNIQAVDGVERVEASYGTDVYINEGDKRWVCKMYALSEQGAADEDVINHYKLIEGRAPQAKDECIVEYRFIKNTGYKIGDYISAYLTGEDDISETLNTTKFKIVGTCKSPMHLSDFLGSSTLGSGNLDYFIMVPYEAFSSEYYTTVYLTAKNSKNYNMFEKEYYDFIAPLDTELDELGKVRSQIRYKKIVDDANEELDDAREKLADGRRERDEKLADAQQKIDDAHEELADGEKKLADAEKDYENGIRKGESQIKKAKADINKGEKELQDNKKKLDAGQKEIDKGETRLNETKKLLDDSKKQLNDSKNQLDQLKQQMDGLAAAIGQLPPEDPDLPQMNAQYETLSQTYDSGMLQYEEGKKQYDGGFAQYKEGKAEFDKRKAEFEEGKKLYEQGVKALQDGKAQVKEAERKLAVGKREGKKKIEEAKVELEDGKKELADNEKEFEDKKIESQQEIDDAQKEIDDAQEQIDNLKEAKWYVLGRKKIESFNNYYNDSNRVGNIGKVFPIIFFLVAALVSLTTMMRMIEEHRTQLGLMKALGYSRVAVTAKYLGYAFVASIIGSGIGMIIGHLVLPRVIFNAYNMMYNLDDIVIRYYNGHSAAAASATVASITVATYLACRKELNTVSADLMRPKPPVKGKRVFLERIGFIWRHLGFNRKITIRNLMRYRLRFVMTVLGVVGCMSLLIMGFGLRDSIAQIIGKQFGEIINYDIEMTYDSGADEAKLNDLFGKVNNDENFVSTMKFYSKVVNVDANGEEMAARLIMPENAKEIENYMSLRTRKGHKPLHIGDDGVVLTEKIGNVMKQGPGGNMQINTDDRLYKAKISALTEHYVWHYIYFSPDYYKSIFGEVPKSNSILIKTTDITHEQKEAIAAEYLKIPEISAVDVITNQNIKDIVDAMDVIIWVLVVSAGALALVVLYNLTNINISERTQELATIKVLGFSNPEVAMYIYRENIIMTAIGIIFGCVLGHYLHSYIVITAEVSDVMFVRTVSYLSYIYSCLITIGFAALVNIIMSRHMRRINMVESLKSGE